MRAPEAAMGWPRLQPLPEKLTFSCSMPYSRHAVIGTEANAASLIMGTLALVTSWLVIGTGIGMAAVATGVVARAQATPGTRETPTAAVGIALGMVSIAVGAGVLAIRV